MLAEFIRDSKNVIVARVREKAVRTVPSAPPGDELAAGVSLFLDQVIAALEPLRRPNSDISDRAARQGADLLKSGVTVGQVVHTYGAVCQAVTEHAVESGAPVTVEEFATLNLSLDNAIASAVSEYSAGRERMLVGEGTERLAALAHEMRDLLFTGMLAFDAIETGKVGVSSSTGAILKKSLGDLSAVVDRSMAAARLELEAQKKVRVRVAELIEQVGLAASFQADDSGHTLVVEPVESGLVVDADPQILGAAIANLLHNAFKFTRTQSRVSLRAFASANRVIIEVADECGGLPGGDADVLFRAHEQRAANRSGLGLGLSISRRGVEANGGKLRARDIPGTGCVFTVDLPRLAPLAV